MKVITDLIDLLRSAKWPEIMSYIVEGFQTFITYVNALYAFIFQRCKYDECSVFGDDKWAKVQIFSLSLIFKLWSMKHYRSPSFQQDMIDNLRNVAIPGTGVPLSVFCYSYWTCLFYVVFLNPFICLMGAINKARKEFHTTLEGASASVLAHFKQHLLHPDDWFSFWRLNCRLVSYHSTLTSHIDYQQEDKWSFLTLGKQLEVPVSPFLDHIPSLVCKNKNIEGGMGIHFFQNAAHGGDWILQERLENADWLNALLPANAPLSTMRVITTSTWALRQTETATSTTAQAEEYVRAESGLLRLGRANASTDHSSVLFDVDIATGEIRQGTSNAHWYQLGLQKAATCPWLPPQETVTRHADAPYPEVTGQCIPNMQAALKIVVESHFKMLRSVPIVGWDVAFTPAGVFLLEVNLSCNFFKGSFDVPRYIDFVHEYWRFLQDFEVKNGIFGYSVPVERRTTEVQQQDEGVQQGSATAAVGTAGLKEE